MDENYGSSTAQNSCDMQRLPRQHSRRKANTTKNPGMRLLESWMNGNVHVRFGGGLTEKCQTSYGYLVTRWLPTLQQQLEQQRFSGGGGGSFLSGASVRFKRTRLPEMSPGYGLATEAPKREKARLIPGRSRRPAGPSARANTE